ncbi:putative metal-binding motif-containing protein [Candidatus Woesearchaeota archaeon]|nr:putative metal-binding motif-containing protein [Candidatus Woesearchaeota archaeon]
MKRGGLSVFVVFLASFILFCAALVIFAPCVFAQLCTFEPKCIPNVQSCGCGGLQTRYTLCNGGCSDWYPCNATATEVICTDTVDDDCDGLIDCADPDCGSNAFCIDADSDSYTLDRDCDDTSSAVYPGAVELCNLVDDDCDGTVDEGCSCTPAGSTQPCGTDAGECSAGVRTCLPGGTWGACTGTPPSVEVCDRLDNDCDGMTDEGCGCVDGESKQCGTDVGICGFGSQLCVSGSWAACTGGISPVAEVCGNALDDNCDGNVDELCPASPELPDADEAPEPAAAPPSQPEQERGLSVAVRECMDLDGDGYGLYCAKGFDCDDNDASVHPGAPEVCNSVDDDCNGMIDDHLSRECGVSDEGVCTIGVERCLEGRWFGCNAVTPSDEMCGNRLDDDCDGSVDEDCAPAGRSDEEAALVQFLDLKFGRGNYSTEEYVENYRQTRAAVSIRKSSVIAGGKTKVKLEIIPVQALRNLTVFLYIPKSVAGSADRVTFSLQPEVIQADPLVAWHFAELSEKADLGYEVVGEFKDAAEKTSAIPVAEGVGPVERPWYFNLIPLAIIPVLGFIFIFLVEIAHKRRR